ncbi:ABC transporter permease [Leptolyngbya cf. ectocarpi LEGE 11479]|uniref:ABC transporter permease n=1 Tax=Leptolyngbya cf. ectocarpi LEGE 11479 TaxID=1828722 RepID=A0A928ZTS9_LEPEC|nr:FtsX-like permease family protein [Leptolyngbya ectocarpi]MBE9067064.1 ABC transporter permease [Leptolyngbya cf. ectocarpi LEGE 11479]
MVSLARKNLLKDLPRFLVAQAGIMFAVSLVTIQTGILKGFTRSTTLLIDSSAADIWVASENIVNFELTEPFPYAQVRQAQDIEGVALAEALTIGSGRWYSDGKLTTLRVFGFDPNGRLFRPGQVSDTAIAALNAPYSALIDRTNMRSFRIDDVGDTARIRQLPVTVVGVTSDTQSLVSSKFVFTSLINAGAYINSGFSSELTCQLGEGDITCVNAFERDANTAGEVAAPAPLNADAPVTYVLVRAAPGENLQQLKQRLEDTLPGTKAFTKDELIDTTQAYWQNRTGIGFILGLGAIVGVIVGMVVVAQILYTSVSENLREFGTLKAMGASDWDIYSVILEQSLWMAVLGYVPGLLLCWGMGTWTAATQGIVVLITPISAIGVFGITVVMCVGSAVFAIQKVTRVDPGIVFKA